MRKREQIPGNLVVTLLVVALLVPAAGVAQQVMTITGGKAGIGADATTPNKLLEPIHDRMPVILSAETRDAWLETADVDLLTPYPADEMEAFSVSTLVNSPNNNAPECIAHEEPKGTLPLFPDWPSS